FSRDWSSDVCSSDLLWRPAAFTTPYRASQEAPAPPRCSGAAATANPDDSRAAHRSAGQWPASQWRISSGVTRSASSRSMVDSNNSRMLVFSTQPETAGDDAAQDFACATTQRVRMCHLHQGRQHLRMVTAPSDGGRHIEHLLGEFRD